MRVTLVGLNFPPEPTGIAPYTGAAAQAIAANEGGTTVLCGYPHYPQWSIAPEYGGRRMHERLGSVEVTRVRHPVPPAGGLAQRIGMELVFGLRAVAASWRRPDVVLAVSPALLSTLMVVVRARLTRIPAIVWVQDVYTLSVTETGTGRRLVGLVRALESLTLRLATRVMVIHPRFRTYVSESLGVDPRRVDVVRNWTHIPASPGRSERARRRFGWGDDDIVVLHAGNMGAKQDLENVVRASELAARSGDPLRFVLLGDGNRRRALEALGPNPCLQFLDPLPDGEFEEALASADVLLVNELPGMTDMSMPSKLTSYFSTGLPVLAAVDASSVTADEVDLSGGGLRVPPGDPRALLQGALRLAGDEALRQELGSRGLRHRNEVLGAQAAVRGIMASLRSAAGVTERRPRRR